MDNIRAKWNWNYWTERAKLDDDNNEIPEVSRTALVDEGGTTEEFQEITGYEITEPEQEGRDEAISDYPENWAEIRDELKDARGWRCELCGFTAYRSAAIQAHHIDHDKNDNSHANLQVLCLTCHKSKHGGGNGMGEGVSPEEHAVMDIYHRSGVAKARLRGE